MLIVAKLKKATKPTQLQQSCMYEKMSIELAAQCTGVLIF